ARGRRPPGDESLGRRRRPRRPGRRLGGPGRGRPVDLPAVRHRRGRGPADLPRLPDPARGHPPRPRRGRPPSPGPAGARGDPTARGPPTGRAPRPAAPSGKGGGKRAEKAREPPRVPGAGRLRGASRLGAALAPGSVVESGQVRAGRLNHLGPFPAAPAETRGDPAAPRSLLKPVRRPRLRPLAVAFDSGPPAGVP